MEGIPVTICETSVPDVSQADNTLLLGDTNKR